MKKQVESEGMGEHFRGRCRPGEHLTGMGLQLFHRQGARTTCRLIGAHHHATHRPAGRQRSQSQGEQDGGAVGVGDHTLMVERNLRIHFRNNQRDPGFHTKRAGVVHHHGPCRHNYFTPLPRYGSAGRGQNQIHVFESRSAHLPNRQFLVVP